MLNAITSIVSENGVEVSRTLVPSVRGTVDNYLPVSSSYMISPDLKLTLKFVPEKSLQCYLEVVQTFLDGTPVTIDPIKLSSEERIAFNERMTALCAAKGYVWPDTGDFVTMDGKQIYPYIDPNAPTTESESESASESDPSEEGSSEAGSSEPSGEGSSESGAPSAEPPSESLPETDGTIPSGGL